MKLTFLGTGTSTGVPQLRCACPACTSSDPRDKRLRASAMIETGGRRLLIDCGPDFREQMLRAGSPDLDALLLTHIHYDHVGGIDDLRPWCRDGRHFPIHCTPDVERDLRTRLPYCFAEHPYPGVPAFTMQPVDPHEPFLAAGVSVTPLPVMHYRLPIIGFRIGPLAYITDAKTIPASTLQLLRGIDTLVVNALRPAEHISHMNLAQALDFAMSVGARRTYLTHISHDMPPHRAVALPPGVALAYDGLEVEIEGG
ncbi:MAG: MBL fold metallo-hydrolase [Muribaculaceae bacterium]|nr:MBL fold metallo-hydrolase [Muribaculaceae bacterium]